MKFVPYEKLSKKQKAILNKSKRKVWAMNPITKKVESSKKYKRKHIDIYDEL